ncbi:MAG: restriction endonuclease subunit S, partial [Mycobacterium sp.]
VGALAVVIPPLDVRGLFADAVWPVLNAADQLLRLSRNIATIRDLLLPKLVTGQVDVSSLDLDASAGKSVA